MKNTFALTNTFDENTHQMKNTLVLQIHFMKIHNNEKENINCMKMHIG